MKKIFQMEVFCFLIRSTLKGKVIHIHMSFSMCAKLCCQTYIHNHRKYDHTTNLLETLHWLPVAQRSQFKVLLMIHKCLFAHAPYDLANLLVFDPSRTGKLKSVNRCNSSWGDRAFSTYAPKVWNCLPYFIRMEPSTEKFKTLLKTHLFTTFYH